MPTESAAKRRLEDELRNSVPFHVRVSAMRAMEDEVECAIAALGGQLDRRLNADVAASYLPAITARMIDALEWFSGNHVKAEFYRGCLNALWPEDAA